MRGLRCLGSAEPEGEVRSLGIIPNRPECVRRLVKQAWSGRRHASSVLVSGSYVRPCGSFHCGLSASIGSEGSRRSAFRRLAQNQATSFSVHYHGFWPQQRKTVSNPLLQDDSGGPRSSVAQLRKAILELTVFAQGALKTSASIRTRSSAALRVRIPRYQHQCAPSLR